MVDVWVWGVVINLIGSTSINLGTNLIKRSHTDNHQRRMTNEAARPWFRCHSWISGMSLFVVGNVLNFISFGFASQTLLASLSSIQFLSNIVCARYIHNQTVNSRVYLSTLWIVLGVVMIFVFASKGTNEFSAEELWELYQNQLFIIYAIFMVLAVIALHVAYVRCQLAYEMEVLTSPPPVKKIPRVIPILYCMVSAMIGTQAVVLAKSASLLLRTTFSGDNQLDSAGLYVVLVLWISAMAFWLVRMNKALLMFDGLLIIPVLQVMWIVFSVIGGGIYFQEFESLSAGSLIGFIGGLFMITNGVYILSSQNAPVPPTSLIDIRSASEIEAGSNASVDDDTGVLHRRTASFMQLLVEDVTMTFHQHPAAGPLVEDGKGSHHNALPTEEHELQV